MNINQLPIDQVRALVQWERLHGRFWKTKLRNAMKQSYYGVCTTDQAAALQRFRNENAALLNQQFSMADLRRRLHHHDLTKAAQALMDKICPVPPAPTYHARREALKVLDMLLEYPEHYHGAF